MADTTGIVTITERRGRESVDTEVSVRSLADLYDACRKAPASRVVKVCLRGPQGDVWLNFASYIHGEKR